MKLLTFYSLMTRKYILISLFTVCMLSSFILFTLFNDELYHRHIAVVDKVTHLKTEQVTDRFHNKDNVVTYKLQLKITNHKEKGQTHTILHSYNKGETYDTKYSEGDKLFVNLSQYSQLKKDYFLSFLQVDYSFDVYCIPAMIDF